MPSPGASTISDPETIRLIVFTRYPQAGKAKTRLIPALGAEGAASLQRQMTEYTLNQVRKLLNPSLVSVDLVSVDLVSVEVWFAGTASSGTASDDTDRQLMQDWLGTGWVYRQQGTGDLGARMSQAFQDAFADGMERVVTIGTDCPGVDANRLTQAFQALQDHDLVLGPATDGGYYLIGLGRFVPELFLGIAWSTADVLSQTIEIAQRLNLSIAYLDSLTDIDRPEDLPVWQAVVETASPSDLSISDTSLSDLSAPNASISSISAPDLSIIIPVLNEANSIQAVLQTIQTSCQERPEIIIVDGGSQDETVTLAKAAGALVITAQPGRAHQMNAGAKMATGKRLLFLHADTRLPYGFDAYVRQTLAQAGVVAGAFQLKIDGKEPGLRLVEWGVKWRSRLLQLPYGDQALFLNAETFHQLGGFPNLPIMEDFAFVQRLQTLGKVTIASAPVITSARRWQKVGIFKTTLINQLVILAYFLGVPLEQIARWYKRGERRKDVVCR